MGSSQSSPSNNQHTAMPNNESAVSDPMPGTDVTRSSASDKSTQQSNEQRKTKKNDKSSQLTGFELIQYKCRRKKRAYDVCYKQWYGSTFTVGQLDADGRENCDDLFEAYQNCILMGIKKDRDRRGVGKANEDSYIGTFESELEDDE